MADFEILKALAGLLSALGTVAVYKFNLAQTQKVRAELLEKFELALEKGQKHTAAELFRLLHGLRMEFGDIAAICAHDKALKIVLALQKTPGMVKVENGLFKYSDLFEKEWVRRSNRWINRSLAYGMGAITVALIIIMATLDGAAALAMLIFVIPSAAFLAMQIKDIRHDNMIAGLVDDGGRKS